MINIFIQFTTRIPRDYTPIRGFKYKILDYPMLVLSLQIVCGVALV